MAVENFTTYTEVDPNSRITKTATRVTWTALQRDEDAYVYKDKTPAYFDGDFIHYLTIRSISAVGVANTATNMHSFWSLANLIGDYISIRDASGDGFFLVLWYNNFNDEHKISLWELDGGVGGNSSSVFEITADANYYLKIVRDESAGTYGTLYCYIYSDAGRTTLVGTLTVTLRSKVDFRYIYGFQTINAGDSTRSWTGYTEDLDLFGDAPTATTQAVSGIATSTATGNGNVTDLGDADVTQHGHCWNTTGTPTTSDNKTENGAKATTGAFTSSLSKLTPSTIYRVRVYATNSVGTSYGNEVSFSTTSGASGTGGGVGGVSGVPSAIGISFPIGETLLVEERLISKPMPEMPMTDIEALVYQWLTRRNIEFQFQTSLMGGFFALGGAVVDFLIPSRNLAWRIFGEYWHRGVQKEGSDVLQKETLAAIGWVVVDLWGDDIRDRTDETLSLALEGREVLR